MKHKSSKHSGIPGYFLGMAAPNHEKFYDLEHTVGMIAKH